MTWPLAFLPYLPAYLVWCALGMALYVAAASDGGRRPERLLMLVVAPAAWINIFAGQSGFLTAALMIAGLAGLDRRPVLSGICFGLLTIKPQLGVLIPLMLVLTQQWRAILAAALTVAALVIATGLLFGFDIWPEYFRQVTPLQSEILTAGQGIFTIMMPTVFMNARGSPIFRSTSPGRSRSRHRSPPRRRWRGPIGVGAIRRCRRRCW
jgi:alpha-1,2-mannosyltransferase